MSFRSFAFTAAILGVLLAGTVAHADPPPTNNWN